MLKWVLLSWALILCMFYLFFLFCVAGYIFYLIRMILVRNCCFDVCKVILFFRPLPSHTEGLFELNYCAPSDELLNIRWCGPDSHYVKKWNYSGAAQQTALILKLTQTRRVALHEMQKYDVTVQPETFLNKSQIASQSLVSVEITAKPRGSNDVTSKPSI